MTACRALLAAAAAALAAASACHALARWAAGDLAALAREGRREAAMEQRLAASREVLQAKTAVVHDLIAGRLTLWEAARRFRELNPRLAGGGNADGIGPYRVVSGEEALWRSVLLWIENELHHHDGRAVAAPTLARLKAEYRGRFGREPEPSPAWLLEP
jgi:hypothetical protein